MYLPTPTRAFTDDYGTITRFGEYGNPYVLVVHRKDGSFRHSFLCYGADETLPMFDGFSN